MKLYHGSTTVVRHPNIKRGRKKTDFGKGFYTTTNFEQAAKWANLKRQRERSGKAIVSIFEVPDSILDMGFKVLRFHKATKEWLDFVVNNRRGIPTENYDLIMGPVAHDTLYTTIQLYENGVITGNAAIEMLNTHLLFDQLSFHTSEPAALLKYVEAIEVHQ